MRCSPFQTNVFNVIIRLQPTKLYWRASAWITLLLNSTICFLLLPSWLQSHQYMRIASHTPNRPVSLRKCIAPGCVGDCVRLWLSCIEIHMQNGAHNETLARSAIVLFSWHFIFMGYPHHVEQVSFLYTYSWRTKYFDRIDKSEAWTARRAIFWSFDELRISKQTR